MTCDDSKYRKIKLWINSIFFLHFIIYIAVNAFLAFINIRTWPQELWFLWTTASWGLGVFIHFGINMLILYILRNTLMSNNN